MSAPLTAEAIVTIEIDPDEWNELKAQGYSDAEIRTKIEEALSHIKPHRAPIVGIDNVKIRKTYGEAL